MKVEWPRKEMDRGIGIDELTNLRIYEFTNLRIYEFDGIADRAAFAGTRIPFVLKGSTEHRTDGRTSCGMRGARVAGVNPRAEALKQRTFTFALGVVRFCHTLRQSWEGRELADQLFRAGTRVGANYRAACRARSHRDFVNKLGHVVEESDETVYWLDLIASSGICRDPALSRLRAEAGELFAIFSQSQLTAKATARHLRQVRGTTPSRPPNP